MGAWSGPPTHIHGGSYSSMIMAQYGLMHKSGKLPHDVNKNLIDKLTPTVKSLAKGDLKAASEDLKALVAQLEALVQDGTLTQDQVNRLLIASQEIITAVANAAPPFDEKLLAEKEKIAKTKEAANLNRPKVSAVFNNYPNPFNPETWIPFQLAEDAKVTVQIYNAQGRLIRTLDLGQKEAGYYLQKEKTIHWDGKDQNGEYVASGIYFYNLYAGSYKATKKMVILK